MPAARSRWRWNRALALDPDTRASLRTLDGRRIALALEAPPLALQVTVDGDRLRVGPVDDANEPDLGIRATLGGLVSQLPFFKRDDAPPVGRVRVSGDADLARRLQRLAERFDPDWQQPFTTVFGDVARRAGRQRVRRRVARSEGRGRGVRGQRRGIPHRGIARRGGEGRTARVLRRRRRLRDDVERLAARVQRLRRGSAA
jgi:ubiquinone biosynthesis protein UbiJ